MRNRGALLLLAALAGCAGEGAGTAPDARGVQGEGNGAVSGTAFLVVPAPDSQFVASQDVRVTVIRVGDFPTEPPPVDSSSAVRQGGSVAPVFLADSVVPPPGTTPPPAPDACAEGDAVSTTVTDAAGKYEVNALEPGIYNLRFEPPASSGRNSRDLCGIAVPPDAPVVVDFYF